jgi:hypothetical protein
VGVEKLAFVDEIAMTDELTISEGAFSGKNWSPEQLKLAFYFYCQTPFGQLHGKNPKIIELAKLIGRTPSALAMKCVNFASLDPAIRDSGRSGLSNASRQDRAVWYEFHDDWERLATECAQLYQHLQREHGARSKPAEGEVIDTSFDLADYTGETRKALVAQRLKQNFFRRAVLSSYRGRCCISGVTEPHLLIASHIVSWSEDKANRLNPSNGLCLSAIHDKAFDAHLFALTDDFHVVLSAKLRATSDHFLKEVFHRLDDNPIAMPERFTPELAFITRHRERMLSPCNA